MADSSRPPLLSGVQRSEEGPEGLHGSAHHTQTERRGERRSHRLPPRRRSGGGGKPSATAGQTGLLRRVRQTTEHRHPPQQRRRRYTHRPMMPCDASTNHMTRFCPFFYISTYFSAVDSASIFKLGVNITKNVSKDMGESH